MKLSIAIVYRDRGFDRLYHCVQSLLNMSGDGYEVIVVDYGSCENQLEQLMDAVTGTDKLRTARMETEGWLFNKSHALNYASGIAKGEYLMVADVDLVFPVEFAEQIISKVSPDKFINYRCIYLNEGQTIDINVKNSVVDFRSNIVSDDTGVGLKVMPLKVLKEINGYNEYYKMWGFEDLEMHRRLLEYGLNHEWISHEELSVFHMWHPMHMDQMPEGWFEEMKFRYDSVTDVILNSPELRLDHFNRPCLGTIKKQLKGIPLKFEEYDNAVTASARVYKEVSNLRPGEILIGSWNSNDFIPEAKDGSLKRVIKSFKSAPKPALKPLNMKTLGGILLFAIVALESQIEDYYLTFDDNQITFAIKP